MTPEVTGRYVKVDGIRLHYLEGGTGDPVLFLHGWPTSSFLWRNILPKIAERNRVIAMDLPGFGLSDKPLDASYSFRFHTRVLDGFLEALKIDATSLVVHDLGGPIGLYWACQNPGRIQKLALLNTLVYPRLSWAVVLFIMACRTPGLGALASSAWGLRAALRIGVREPNKLTKETIRSVQAPFQTRDSRRALLKAGYGLHPSGLKDIARLLPAFTVPVRIIYGARDRILPDVARTMAHVARDLPQAQVTALPDCGHFLQEECPEKIADLLAEFLRE